MTIEAYEEKRQAHAMKVQALLSPQPKPRGIRVRCIEHPEWGAIDIVPAARRAGGFPYKLLAAAKACRQYRGARWHLDGQPFTPKPVPPHRRGQSLHCVEADRDFISIGEAAAWLSQRTGKPAWPNAIKEAMARGGRAYGYTFARLLSLAEGQRTK